VNEEHNTDDVQDVLEREEDYNANLTPVLVCVSDDVRVKELPTIIGPCKNFIIGPNETVQILDENPRRKSALIEVQNGDICVGGTKQEASGWVGAIRSGSLSVPAHYGFKSALFARPVFVDVSGSNPVLTVATEGVVVSVTEEFWTR